MTKDAITEQDELEQLKAAVARLEADRARERASKKATDDALSLPSAPIPSVSSQEMQARQEKMLKHRRHWAEQHAAEVEAWTERNRGKIKAHESRVREVQQAIAAEAQRHESETGRLGARLAEVGRDAPRPPAPRPCPPLELPPLESAPHNAIHPSVLERARARAGR